MAFFLNPAAKKAVNHPFSGLTYGPHWIECYKPGLGRESILNLAIEGQQ